jgi:hypothetical protein
MLTHRTSQRPQVVKGLLIVTAVVGPDGLNRYQRYRKRHPEVMRQRDRENGLKRHNITSKQYFELLDRQDRKCAICEVTVDDFGKNFHVDHDHSCCPGKYSCGECIRGLLCSNCNTAVGLLNENLDTIMKAHQYLQGSWRFFPATPSS